MLKSIQNSEHYKWGDHCDGWHLLKTNTLSVIQEKMPAGTSERLHYHVHAQQLFYILAGTATFEIEGSANIVEAGESFHIEKGRKHSIANRGSNPLEFLVISEPKAHGDRIENHP